MSTISINEFVEEGSLFGYKIGDALDSKLLGFVIEKSIKTNKNGFSELMELKINNIKITIGIDDLNQIRYIMIKFPKHNPNIDFLYKNFSFTKNNLSEILDFLSFHRTDWAFTEILGKVLRIKIGKVELVYSYEIDEVGIYCIQVVD